MTTSKVNLETPAIAGGKPIKETPFTMGPKYGAEELQQLKEALDQQTLFYFHGKKTSELEAKMAKLWDAKYAAACSSGTAALHIATCAIGISPGDEVITTPITDMGTLIAILAQGGVPVFADLDPHSHVITPESVEAAITPKTRAVIAVHLWGNACDLYAIKDICDKHDIVLIEDCAQAWGCTYDDKPIGKVGQIGCFSLNEFKHIGCGDGGLVITNDKELYRKLKLSADKAYNREPGVLIRDPIFLAPNYRITELQSAVAIAQLDKLPGIVERRRKLCETLSERLSTVKGVTIPQPTPRCNPAWWFYMLRIQPETLGVDAATFAEAVCKEGIPVGAGYIGRPVYEYHLMVEHSAYDHGDHPFSAREYGRGICPTAEEILKTAIVMTIKESYTEQDIDETARGITRVANWFSAGNR